MREECGQSERVKEELVRSWMDRVSIGIKKSRSVGKER
jgi:hypothetical protein